MRLEGRRAAVEGDRNPRSLLKSEVYSRQTGNGCRQILNQVHSNPFDLDSYAKKNRIFFAPRPQRSTETPIWAIGGAISVA